jgi:hypothetical protein
MGEDNVEIKESVTAGKSFGDIPVQNEFRDVINTSSQRFYFTKDSKQAIRVIEAHYATSQIDRHFNQRGCKIAADLVSYTYKWTMYIEF